MAFAGGSCTEYFVDDGHHMSWDDANVYCQRNGGSLVKIDNQHQQQCLNQFLNDIGGNIYTVLRFSI